MNKILKLIIVIFFTLLIFNHYFLMAEAQTLIPSPTLSDQSALQEDKEIQSLKEKIATKVAELREKNSKAISGIVQESLSTQGIIKIKTGKGEDFEVKIDPDLTKFYQILGNQKKEVKAASVKKDSYILVTGIIKEKIIDANVIYLDEMFIIGLGKVIEANTEDFFIRVITSDKENYTLDVETFTKQQLLNIKLLTIENVGFSKIKEGDSIQFVVKKITPNEVNRFPAQKILIIPQEYFIK